VVAALGRTSHYCRSHSHRDMLSFRNISTGAPLTANGDAAIRAITGLAIRPPGDIATEQIACETREESVVVSKKTKI
jgi:hypothetical protein